MKTAILDKSEITRKWYIVDANKQVLGRFASEIAKILMGKNKPEYSTFQDMGDNVVVINAANVVLSGNKETTKTYFSHSTYPGGGKTISFAEAMEKDPASPLEKAVRGMLPKNTRGREMFKKLFVYGGDIHPHLAQKPEPIKL